MPSIRPLSPRFHRTLRSALALGIGLLVLTAFGCGSDASSPDAPSTSPDTSASSPTASVALPDTLPPQDRVFDVQAVTFDARRPPPSGALDAIHDMGTTHLTLIPFGWQKEMTEPYVRLRPNPSWYSESDAGIRELAREASARDMQIILKPHVWIGGYSSDGQSRDVMGFDTEAEWEQWEASYRRFLMHYAHLAADIDAPILVVGTELKRAVTTRETFWRSLIAEVRTVYDGKLTYAANWYEEYDQVPFWDALDYIGIQAYFPLLRDDGTTPTLESLLKGWQAHRADLQRVHEATGKPVLFTEIGYRSVRYAARTPWRWPQRDEAESMADPALQAACYRAFFATFARTPWFVGAVLWKWHPDGEGDRPLGFTPQNKPAQGVIQAWF